jgi:hypothetical protein
MRSLISAGVIVLAVTALSACGGGGGGSHATPAQTIRGSSFVFKAPFGWQVRRRGSAVVASPKPIAPELVSVSRFPTTKPYHPSLFTKAIPELDRLANDYAGRLGGSVRSSATVRVGGERVRQYTVQYKQGSQTLAERITFFFRGRTEYQLLCQWKASDAEPSFCAQLTASFTPT